MKDADDLIRALEDESSHVRCSTAIALGLELTSGPLSH